MLRLWYFINFDHVKIKLCDTYGNCFHDNMGRGGDRMITFLLIFTVLENIQEIMDTEDSYGLFFNSRNICKLIEQ